VWSFVCGMEKNGQVRSERTCQWSRLYKRVKNNKINLTVVLTIVNTQFPRVTKSADSVSAPTSRSKLNYQFYIITYAFLSHFKRLILSDLTVLSGQIYSAESRHRYFSDFFWQVRAFVLATYYIKLIKLIKINVSMKNFYQRAAPFPRLNRISLTYLAATN